MIISLLRYLAAFAALIAAPQAQADPHMRVALALHQTARVEAMGASACFAMGGIDAHRQEAAAREAVELFGTTLSAFLDGHQWLGVDPATDPELRDSISAVRAHWDAYAPAFHQILAGDLHAVVMAQLLGGTEPTARIAQDLAAQFMDAPGAVEPALKPALLLAARQRMLIERALRQTCLVHLGLAGAPTRAALTETLELIGSGAARLATGGGDVPAPPDARIARNLRTADLFWSKMLPTIARVAAGAPVTDTDIAKALKLNISVQKQLVQAVDVYAASKG